MVILTITSGFTAIYGQPLSQFPFFAENLSPTVLCILLTTNFQIFIENLVVSRMKKPHPDIMKTVEGDSFPRKPLLFQKKLATLQTGKCVDFQNILNRPTNRCL